MMPDSRHEYDEGRKHRDVKVVMAIVNVHPNFQERNEVDSVVFDVDDDYYVVNQRKQTKEVNQIVDYSFLNYL